VGEKVKPSKWRAIDPYSHNADQPSGLIDSKMMAYEDSALGYRVECGG
jgi:hypothetical protein